MYNTELLQLHNVNVDFLVDYIFYVPEEIICMLWYQIRKISITMFLDDTSSVIESTQKLHVQLLNLLNVFKSLFSY